MGKNSDRRAEGSNCYVKHPDTITRHDRHDGTMNMAAALKSCHRAIVPSCLRGCHRQKKRGGPSEENPPLTFGSTSTSLEQEPQAQLRCRAGCPSCCVTRPKRRAGRVRPALALNAHPSGRWPSSGGSGS